MFSKIISMVICSIKGNNIIPLSTFCLGGKVFLVVKLRKDGKNIIRISESTDGRNFDQLEGSFFIDP